MDFLSPFRGELGAGIDFTLHGGEGQASVSRSFAGNLHVADGRYQVDAREVARLIPGQLVELDGRIELLIDDWFFKQQLPESLRADVNWSDAALRSPTSATLGTVSVAIVPNANGHSAQIQNSGGQLSINGKVDVDKRGGYRADIRLKPSASAPADLDGTLGLLGRKGSDGSYRLRQNGRLSDFL